jgi:hypothetical protein
LRNASKSRLCMPWYSTRCQRPEGAIRSSTLADSGSAYRSIPSAHRARYTGSGRVSRTSEDAAFCA